MFHGIALLILALSFCMNAETIDYKKYRHQQATSFPTSLMLGTINPKLRPQRSTRLRRRL